MRIGRFKLTRIESKNILPVILVMLLLFISIACANMLIPSYSKIKEDFGVPETLLAIPDAFFMLVSACFALIWGYYTDRVNRTKVIMGGAFSWTFGMMLTALSFNYQILIISRMLSGAGLGCVLPVGYSIIADAIPPNERSGWFGTLAILSSISNGSGQGLSSFLGPIFGWHFPFFLLSAISICIVFTLFFVKIPQRGASEDELIDLRDFNLEYQYTITKKDLSLILKKKTNRYLIIQDFFLIIPGTITVFFLTSMLNIYYLYQIPDEIRLQTATIMAGIIGIGYILGNLTLSRLGDILYKKNKKNRTRLATICVILALPFFIATLLSIQPVEISKLNIVYPSVINTSEIGSYMIRTIFEIFRAYPSYILYFIFGLLGTMFGAGPVANRNAVIIDINLPEHRGTSVSFMNLSEQVGKGITLMISYFLISLLGNMFNMMLFSTLFWIPASIFWILANKTVGRDLTVKSMLLSERQQIGLIDYVFELEIQMDRAIQKVQDSKYYIMTDHDKFNELISDAIKILKQCERESETRSITNIKTRSSELLIIAESIKRMTTQIYEILGKEDLSSKEVEMLNEDLKQVVLKIAEGEKSTFGELQIYFEDASLKIVEARLLRNNDLLKCRNKIMDAIKIYQRTTNLLNERLEIIPDNSQLSEEDSFVYNKEKRLLEKCKASLDATLELKNKIENIITQLNDEGITEKDLMKISELTLEYNVNLYNVIFETLGKDQSTQKKINIILKSIEDIFNEYDKWKEVELKVF